MDEKHLSIEELAERLGVPIETVNYWRKRRTGPPYLKYGKHIKYRVADVKAWEKSRLVTSGTA